MSMAWGARNLICPKFDFSQAAALFAAEALGCDQKGRSQILGCDTQEAEGYLVEPDGSVSLLRRPR